MVFHAFPICTGWEFSRADSDKWFPVSQFPTNVHLDLLANGLLEDPFVGKNEAGAQGIGEAQWKYRTAFVTPPTASPLDVSSFLVFDGLDTFASVVLNSRRILEADNMFVPYRVDVTDCLQMPGSENLLEITFDSAYRRGWAIVDESQDHKWGCWNGDISRLAVRKAQYHWGWDWGPALLTCGPWRPIHLETYDVRIADLKVVSDVEKSLNMALVQIAVDVETPGAEPSQPLHVVVLVTLDGSPIHTRDVQGDPLMWTERLKPTEDSYIQRASLSFVITNPRLWYPAHYGEQPLYTITANLMQGDVIVHQVKKKTGLRRAELVQHELSDEPGTSFFFKINNVRMFVGGSNWIPADSFLPRISTARYHDWVRLAKDGNQAMLRVWGGGIYEEQAFYDACDQMGVMVWQDFMFACGNYPAWLTMRASIRLEATVNVVRLRHHPSIVVWAGNNEDYQYREEQQLTYDYADKDAQSWLKTDFPARYIYEHILKEVCTTHAPFTAYHFGSPWGAGKDTHDATVGDIHQWNVWHGSQARYQDFDQLGGRFVSEFGMQALPDIATVDAMLPQGVLDPDRYPWSSTLDFHNKATGHERRLAAYLAENVGLMASTMERHVFLTQVMQAECLATAYRLWKRQWKGHKREYCGGALVWQLNDCWPATSWSVCDYYQRPKLAYYAIKRELAPLTVGMRRKTITKKTGDMPHSRVNVTKEEVLEVWATNLLPKTEQGITLLVLSWDIETGEKGSMKVAMNNIDLGGSTSTELLTSKMPVDDRQLVVAAYLTRDGEQLARHVNWPEPLKYLHLKHDSGHCALSADGTSFILQATMPVKGATVEVISDDKDAVSFGDNMVDLVPHETVKLPVLNATLSTKFRVMRL